MASSHDAPKTTCDMMPGMQPRSSHTVGPAEASGASSTLAPSNPATQLPRHAQTESQYNLLERGDDAPSQLAADTKITE